MLTYAQGLTSTLNNKISDAVGFPSLISAPSVPVKVNLRLDPQDITIATSDGALA